MGPSTWPASPPRMRRAAGPRHRRVRAAAAAGARTPIRIHAGFLPRSYARIVMRESAAALRRRARTTTPTSVRRHRGALQLLRIATHRPQPARRAPPTDEFRKMFPAQIIKDAAMAHRVATLAARAPLATSTSSSAASDTGLRPRRAGADPPRGRSPSMLRVWSLPADAAAPRRRRGGGLSSARNSPGARTLPTVPGFQEVAAAAVRGRRARGGEGGGGEQVGETAARGTRRRCYADAVQRRRDCAAGDDAANFQGGLPASPRPSCARRAVLTWVGLVWTRSSRRRRRARRAHHEILRGASRERAPTRAGSATASRLKWRTSRSCRSHRRRTML